MELALSQVPLGLGWRRDDSSAGFLETCPISGSEKAACGHLNAVSPISKQLDSFRHALLVTPSKQPCGCLGGTEIVNYFQFVEQVDSSLPGFGHADIGRWRQAPPWQWSNT